MAVNSRYTAEGNKGSGGKEFPKLPYINIKAIGDKFQGTLKEVSERFTIDKPDGKGGTRSIPTEVWTYTDVVVINNVIDDDGKVTEVKTEIPEAQFWYQKANQFTAIGDSLAEVGLDDPKIGSVHQFKRITDGQAKALKDGTMGSAPHRFLSKFSV